MKKLVVTKYVLAIFILSSLLVRPAIAQEKSDTFRYQNYPLKVWYGSERYKNLNKLEPYVLAKNDLQIQNDWKNGKMLKKTGLIVQLIGVGIMGFQLADQVKSAKENSFYDGGSLSSYVLGSAVIIGGLVIQIGGVSKYKKAFRRYNQLQRENFDLIDPIPLIDIAKTNESEITVLQMLKNAEQYYLDKNYNHAFKIFNKYKDYSIFSVENTNTLGKMYFNGSGTGQNYKAASNLFEKAAALGNDKSMYNLGIMYYEGKGVVRDLSKAYDWFKKSAELGNVNAKNNLTIIEKEMSEANK